MRLLFDENLPEGLEAAFASHECSHVNRLGWAGIRNGNLLRKGEEEGSDVLLTFDQGFPTQQNLTNRKISILILKPHGQGVQAVRNLCDLIEETLPLLKEGEVRMISNRPNMST